MNNVFLAIVQGLTEFLPVSSSGHLVLFGKMLGTTTDISFTALLHLGTLLAVFVFAFKSLIRALKNWKIIVNLVISTVPAVAVGFTLDEKIERTFNDTKFLPIFFCTTSVLLLLASMKKGSRTLEEMSFFDALIIGLFQAIAIFPGVSRSGSTIAASLLLNFKKEDSLSYSFLLALPVIAGAGLLKSSQMDPKWFYLGAISFVVGLFALFLLRKIILSDKLKIFSVYCLVIGLVSFFVR
ncbi:MAG TPA: undecaprenyl-diphosphate phosphatase [Pseudothermotoga sp.]|nr:undecaprenyl-diphosphate phosphatase [Pseudothermotoga sp.]HPP70072.1 undecaprenyl-diphosphate phosphatase [Pseudothermotoga sp.]